MMSLRLSKPSAQTSNLGDNEVLEAYNGLEALKVARREKPDLMVLDVLTPEMDGWQVLRESRGDTELKDLPVVLTPHRSFLGQGCGHRLGTWSTSLLDEAI